MLADVVFYVYVYISLTLSNRLNDRRKYIFFFKFFYLPVSSSYIFFSFVFLFHIYLIKFDFVCIHKSLISLKKNRFITSKENKNAKHHSNCNKLITFHSQCDLMQNIFACVGVNAMIYARFIDVSFMIFPKIALYFPH